MVFTESPYDRCIEMLMISVPGFKSAGGGRRHKVSIEYTAEMCACKLCLYYKKRKCTAEKCPCLKERIIADVVPISMVQMETMSAIHHPAFQARLKKYIKESEIGRCFLNRRQMNSLSENYAAPIAGIWSELLFPIVPGI